MLTGDLPYGTQVPKSRTKSAQKKLVYQSVLSEEREIPAWVDDAMRKAVDPDPSHATGGTLRVHLRPAPPQPRFPQQDPATTDRAQSGHLLEKRFAGPARRAAARLAGVTGARASVGGRFRPDAASRYRISKAVGRNDSAHASKAANASDMLELVY